MRQIYSIGIFLYGMAIRIAANFNDKARSWRRGRAYIFTSLLLQLKNFKHVIWVHCASYGEFEQGKPIIEKIKSDYPEYKVLLTFFSPSGYEHFYKYDKADYVYYLPLDTKRNAKRFIDIIHPECIIFIKYEYWFNYIQVAWKRKIPFYIASATFRPNQYFFKPYGYWFLRQLKKITYFFLQDETSEKLLKKNGIDQCGIFGDTRFDTVVKNLKNVQQNEIAKNFSEGKKILIAGSTWEADEKILHNLLSKTDYSLILTPHEVHKGHLELINELFKDYSCLSYTEAENTKARIDYLKYRVLIIDTIGLLKNLYPYGKIAYIGGGFARGIHNTLEAATFGIPIIFGPNYKHFKEACDLIEKGGAFCVHSESEMLEIFTKLTEDEKLMQYASEQNKNYVKGKTGVSERIVSKILD